MSGNIANECKSKKSVIISLRCWRRLLVCKMTPFPPRMTGFPLVWVGVSQSLSWALSEDQPPGTTWTHLSFASQAGESLREVSEADTSVWNELNRRLWTQGQFQKDWESGVGAQEKGNGRKWSSVQVGHSWVLTCEHKLFPKVTPLLPLPSSWGLALC